MRRLVGLFVASALVAGMAGTAIAQERGGQERNRHEQERDGRDRGHEWDRGWHDRDIHRFHERDVDVWRGGRWFQGRHGGRAGWWWVVGNAWYYYPQPVYPYPDPYQPPVVAPPPAPSAQVYYYCPNPRGYYPYVAACRVPWRAVPG